MAAMKILGNESKLQMTGSKERVDRRCFNSRLSAIQREKEVMLASPLSR